MLVNCGSSSIWTLLLTGKKEQKKSWVIISTTLEIRIPEPSLQVDTAIKDGRGLESKYGEDDGRGIDGSQSIRARDEHDVLDAVVFGFIVTSKCNQRAECEPKGIENLRRSIQPNCHFRQFVQLKNKPCQLDPAFPNRVLSTFTPNCVQRINICVNTLGV